VVIIYLEARIKREIGYDYARNRESDRYRRASDSRAEDALRLQRVRGALERGFVRDRSGKSLLLKQVNGEETAREKSRGEQV
jgi:hypothetical protein